MSGNIKKIEVIPLWDESEVKPDADGFKPVMEIYQSHTQDVKGAVVICPGGGYGHRAWHEGELIARHFNAHGLHAFVVQYRVTPNHHPKPLDDVSRAVRLVRLNAEKWLVNPDKIAVCGFSAGGHLAASSGVLASPGNPDAENPVDRISSRPNAMILCYAVLSSDPEIYHQGSFKNLLGEDHSEEEANAVSMEKQVDENTPPAFLWHTAEDPGVPAINSLRFAEALGKHKIPYELHVFPEGRHGLGLAQENPHVAVWFDLCCRWLKTMDWGNTF